MTIPAIRVSDHAIQRYQERIETALTPEQIRAAIAELVRPAAAIRANRYRFAGVSFCLSYTDGRAVVTTVYVGQTKSRSANRGRRRMVETVQAGAA